MRIVSLLMMCAIALVSGCSKGEDSPNSSRRYASALETSPGREEPTASAKLVEVPIDSLRIGIAWEGSSGMAKRVAAGFLEGMQRYESVLDVEWQTELTSLEALHTEAQRFQADKSAMLILRSSGAKYLAKNSPTIPTFIGACNHPVQLGAVADMAVPGGNVTGVTYALSYDQQFEAFRAVVGDLDSVCLIYEIGHPGSALDRSGTEATAEKLGIHYSEIGCKTADEVLAAVTSSAPTCTAVILGNQALVFEDAAPLVAAAGTTPLLAYSQKPVQHGVLCGLTADDHKLGRLLAESLIDVCVRGKAVSSIPIKVDDAPKLHVNITTAERVGLVLPASILKVANIVR